MWSFDFGEIEALQHAGRWDEATTLLIEAARRLERGGADFFLLCTNTMHRMADEVSAAVRMPLLHIADPTAERIRAQDVKTVGLLGTAFTSGGCTTGSASTCWCLMPTIGLPFIASSTTNWWLAASRTIRANDTVP